MSEARLRELPEQEPPAEVKPPQDIGIEGKVNTIDEQLCWTNYSTVKNSEEITRIRKDVDEMSSALARLKTISMILLVMCGAMAVVLLIHLAP